MDESQKSTDKFSKASALNNISEKSQTWKEIMVAVATWTWTQFTWSRNRGFVTCC